MGYPFRAPKSLKGYLFRAPESIGFFWTLTGYPIRVPKTPILISSNFGILGALMGHPSLETLKV